MGVHKTEVYDQIKDLLEIPRDEPIFILRAQDSASEQTLIEYKYEAGLEGAAEEFQDQIDAVRDRFVKWQNDNKAKVKVPD